MGRMEAVFTSSAGDGPNTPATWNGVPCYATTWVAEINYPQREVAQ